MALGGGLRIVVLVLDSPLHERLVPSLRVALRFSHNFETLFAGYCLLCDFLMR